MNKFFLSVLVLILLASCSSNVDTLNDSSGIISSDSDAETMLLTPMMTAKDMVDNNTYIDVDIEAFDKVVRDNFDPQKPETSLIAMKLYPEEYAMIRAARYRYGKTISVVDGYWVSSAEKGSDLNISERTFKFMHDNTESINAEVKRLRDNGEDVSLPEYSKSYLEVLLKETPR